MSECFHSLTAEILFVVFNIYHYRCVKAKRVRRRLFDHDRSRVSIKGYHGFLMIEMFSTWLRYFLFLVIWGTGNTLLVTGWVKQALRNQCRNGISVVNTYRKLRYRSEYNVHGFACYCSNSNGKELYSLYHISVTSFWEIRRILATVLN